jgi:predicted ester cyclase
MLRSAFPDLKFDTTIEHQVAEGDYFAARITYHITNAGKEATGYGVCEYRLANDKIVEEWPPKDTAILLQQVGAILPSG